MAELLVPLRSKPVKSNQTNESRAFEPVHEQPEDRSENIQSAAQAVEILKCQPPQETLIDVLEWLQPSNKRISGFDIQRQTSLASQILHLLVNDVLPDHWCSIFGDANNNTRKTRNLVLSVLCNVGGISAIATRLKVVIKQLETTENTRCARQKEQVESLENTLSLLELVLAQESCIHGVWLSLTTSEPNATRRWLLWKELIALLGNGRVLSLASEADHIVAKASPSVREASWLSDGIRYSLWVGKNLVYMLEEPNGSKGIDSDARKAWVQMLERALTLGHVDSILQPILERVVEMRGQLHKSFRVCMVAIKGSSKRMVLYSILRILAKTRTSTPLQSDASDKSIAGAAALIHFLSKRVEDLANFLLQWLSSDGLVQDFSIRRAVVAALAEDFDRLKIALSESLQSFGDKISIKHTPILQQEGTAENLLLLTGYAHRANHQHVSEMARSGPYLNAISNRLAASSSRASLLGMCVGTAVSELIDPPDRRMNFSSEEVTSSQGQRFLRLTKVHDPMGSIDDLQPARGVSVPKMSRNQKHLPVKVTKPPNNIGPSSTESKIISIEEIESESEDEDGGLPTYAKPDSDASDEDEDPTLVNRDRPTVPVYVNDLISGLRDTENYDRHTLALTNASSLIRRKAAFGNEVLDSTEELASILTGLQDKWNLEAFQEIRLQAMIAVLVAQPLEMGQWFSRTYFNGDYSISQRATVLTTLGLGARELAGYGKDDTTLAKFNRPSKVQRTPFPSKQLPPKLHALYAPEEPLTTTSKKLENAILQPMALKAADTLSGPNVLKTRTFSSRMDVERKRTKAIPNALAKVVADGFFFPLTGRFQTHIGTS
ncbi:MAG: hypothetical protein LQ352_008292, partial [Teloschistes flavicans]